MRGYPHTIGTAQDLNNLLSLVQAGELQKADLLNTISALEAQQIITCPIVAISDDRKTVTLNYCAEAKTGQAIADGVTISAISTAGTDPDGKQTVLTLSVALPAGQTIIPIPNPAEPLKRLGIMQTQLDTIKEALSK